MSVASDDDARPPLEPRPQPAITSEELLRGSREVAIVHAGVIYRLRITSNEKLILTK